MPDPHRLQLARRLAQEAGAMAHTGFGTSAVSSKGRHDEVTAMDRAVERFIRAEIARALPDDAVLGEEDGPDAALARAGHVWVIDPIDGTANYARGIAHYAVSIGVLSRASAGHAPAGAGPEGWLSCAALMDPCQQRLYTAARGQGAWLETAGGAPQRLACSPRADIGSATVELGWSTRRPAADYQALLKRLMDAGCAVRRAGSGALGIVDVACGRAEAYLELHINSWDCAAGLLLVAEAGGRCNRFFDGQGLLHGNPVLATNAALAQAIADAAGIAALAPAPD